MAYSVDLTTRASRDLASLYRRIHAANSEQAWAWFNDLETAIYSLDRNPARGRTIPEAEGLRHLLYGKKPHLYRIIYDVDERRRIVTVLHIRYAARKAYTLEGRVSLPHGRDQRLRRGDSSRESSGRQLGRGEGARFCCRAKVARLRIFLMSFEFQLAASLGTKIAYAQRPLSADSGHS